jgi:hypothetical protein
VSLSMSGISPSQFFDDMSFSFGPTHAQSHAASSGSPTDTALPASQRTSLGSLPSVSSDSQELGLALDEAHGLFSLGADDNGLLAADSQTHVHAHRGPQAHFHAHVRAFAQMHPSGMSQLPF